MRLDRPAAALAMLGLAAFAEPAGAAELQPFASPMLSRAGNAGVANATCYFRNAGEKPVRLTSSRLLSFSVGDVSLQSDTCGGAAGINLAPGATCFIGANSPPSLLSCAAMVDDTDAMRGAMELRKADGTVVDRTMLSAGSGGRAANEFATLASTTTFSAPSQTFVLCFITNFGTKPVKLKDKRITTSTGAPIPFHFDSCDPTLAPSASCQFTARASNPTTDRACSVAVTRKANVRGTISYAQSAPDAFTWAPME